MKIIKLYTPPEIDVVEFKSENGFATSGMTAPDFGEGGNL